MPSGISLELIYVANMLVEYITFKKMPGIGVFPCFVAARLDDPLLAGCRSITSPRCRSSVLASPISRGSCDQPRPTLQDMPRSQPTKKRMAMSSSTRVDGDRPLRRSSLKLTSGPGSPTGFAGLCADGAPAYDRPGGHRPGPRPGLDLALPLTQSWCRHRAQQPPDSLLSCQRVSSSRIFPARRTALRLRLMQTRCLPLHAEHMGSGDLWPQRRTLLAKQAEKTPPTPFHSCFLTSSGV